MLSRLNSLFQGKVWLESTREEKCRATISFIVKVGGMESSTYKVFKIVFGLLGFVCISTEDLRFRTGFRCLGI